MGERNPVETGEKEGVSGNSGVENPRFLFFADIFDDVVDHALEGGILVHPGFHHLRSAHNHGDNFFFMAIKCGL